MAFEVSIPVPDGMAAGSGMSRVTVESNAREVEDKATGKRVVKIKIRPRFKGGDSGESAAGSSTAARTGSTSPVLGKRTTRAPIEVAPRTVSIWKPQPMKERSIIFGPSALAAARNVANQARRASSGPRFLNAPVSAAGALWPISGPRFLNAPVHRVTASGAPVAMPATFGVGNGSGGGGGRGRGTAATTAATAATATAAGDAATGAMNAAGASGPAAPSADV